MQHLEEIFSHFDTKGSVAKIAPMGNGLINDTYRVTTSPDSAPDYVLQRINHHIFTNVEGLQRNIAIVTETLADNLRAQGVTDISRRVLQFVPLKGKPDTTFFFDGENYWRVMVFIPDAITCETVDEHYSECAGEAFGQFQAALTDVADRLVETIPDFHNMEFRITQLSEAIHNDAAGRLESVRDIADRLMALAPEMTRAEQLFRQGKLAKRTCHCDTKVNNMLFDADGSVLCVIDLDTVMPSFIFSDFGDFLRTAANTGAEDDPDLSRVNFNIDIFKAFAKGYLRGAASFLTPVEIENLPFAATLFPYMQAVRFFIDYLNGDTYYKIQYPDHNLVRTKAQIKLFDSALHQLPQMTHFIHENAPKA